MSLIRGCVVRNLFVAGRGFAIPFAPESNTVKTVKQAIGRLAKAGKSRDKLHNLPENRSQKVVSLIKSIPRDGGSRTDLPRSRQLACQKRCTDSTISTGAWHGMRHRQP